LIYGGGALQLTATTTLTAAQICDNSVIKYYDVAGAGGTTPTDVGALTLASSTDLIADCLSAIGDTKEVLLLNNSTTTLALSVRIPTADDALLSGGIELMYVAGGSVTPTAGEYALLRFTNINNTTTSVLMMDVAE